MDFNKSGIVMASIGNINRGIYLIIDVVDYKMWPKPQQACLLSRLEDGWHHFTTSSVFQAKERKIYQCGGAANNAECRKVFSRRE